MSLSTETPAPLGCRMHAVPAAWRTPPRRAAPMPPRPPSAAKRARTSTPAPAEKLFRRFVQLLAAGDHPFSQLREDFSDWCREGDVPPPSVTQLAAWLKAAGLTQSRRGRKKITTYTKRAARLAA